MNESKRWIDELGYDRMPGALLRREKECPADHPYSFEIRSTFAPAQDRLSPVGLFCVERVPTVYLVSSDELSEDSKKRTQQLREFCERLWNQNLARAVIVLGQDSLEAWSVDNPRVHPELVTGSNATISDWSAQGILSGEVLNKRNAWFDPHKRVDRHLLENIKDLITGLRKAKLPPDFARELIAKVIFVAYLEDREIVTAKYHEVKKVKPIYDLLGSRDAIGLERLFRRLRTDFNGDFLRPTVKSAEIWRKIPGTGFDLLHQFLARTVLRSGQKDFWRYDFGEIPIELIAGIYETFLGSKAADEIEVLATSTVVDRKIEETSRRKQGAYYTPRLLAEWVVDLAFQDREPLEQRVFDGACGSGMLLTAAFRRLIRAQQAKGEQLGRQPSTWGFKARCKLLLDHIFGGDVDADACRLTAFSLYLALLSDLASRDLLLLQQGGNKLPRLNRNIRSGLENGQFFSSQSEKANRNRYTIFLSNPPWRELPANDPAAEIVDKWQARQSAPRPRIPNRQIAAAFALAAADCLRPTGRAAFILPVNPFVSSKPSARDFRADLLGRYRIHQIINFSDMRRLIFPDSDHPFVVLVADARRSPDRYKSVANETFEYWTPKTDISLAFGRLAIHGVDRTSLASSLLIDETPHLRMRYWGNEQDVTLLRRLTRHGRVGDLIKFEGWASGKGFHLKDEDRRRPEETWYVPVPESLKTASFLDADKFPADLPIIEGKHLEPFPYDEIARVPEERFFEGPRVLWPDGTHPENGVKAIFSDQKFSFRHSLGVLSAPKSEVGRLTARFLTAYLRSPLGIWLSLLLSSSVASERPKLHVSELLDWPFWAPDRHIEPEIARRILEEVDGSLASIEAAPELARVQRYQDCKPLLDDAVFRYFLFKEEERVLVQELAKYAGASLQPTSLRYGALRKPIRIPPSESILQAYCNRLRKSFCSWRDVTGGKGDITVVPWTAHSVPLGAAVMQLHVSSQVDSGVRSRVQDDRILDELVATVKKVSGSSNSDILTIPNLTLVENNRILIVKPLVTRFWLERSAMEDAGRIAMEIQSVERARLSA